MTSIGHLAITSLARNNPIGCLIWGNISHWMLDETCSEYKLESISAKHLIPYIAWQGIISMAFLYYTKCWWAILGLLPDIIEGVYIAIKGIEIWNSGDLLFWFHRPKAGSVMWSKKFTMAMEIALMIIVISIIRG